MYLDSISNIFQNGSANLYLKIYKTYDCNSGFENDMKHTLYQITFIIG